MAQRLKAAAGIDQSRNPIEPASYTSQYVEAGGLRLHYLDYGTAGMPAMLCVHGGAAHAHWFDFVAPSFTPDYHVRSLDLRGHGDSEWAQPPAYDYDRYASDLAEVVEKLDLHDFVLIGHSMGGMVSLVYAATFPGRVARLIVVDSTLRMSEDRVAKLRDVGARQGTSYATRDEFIARYRLRPAGSTAAPEIIRHLAQNSTRETSDGRWQHKFDRNVYTKRESLDGFPRWNDVTIPSLLIKGDRSQRITLPVFAEVKARCSLVELAEVEQSDHHVMLDNPAGFALVVKEFLARHA